MFKPGDKIVNKIVDDSNEIKQLNEEIGFGLFIIASIIAAFILGA